MRVLQQTRDELLYSSVKGRNPLKDLRVRQAIMHAIDREGIAAAITVLGFLNSGVFNAVLGRSDYASETFREVFVWGMRSVVIPLSRAVMVLAPIGVMVFLRLMFVDLFQVGRRFDTSLRAHLGAVARTTGIDKVPVLASGVILLAVTAGACLWWRFGDLTTAMTSRVSTAPIDVLAWLSPTCRPEQNAYRSGFTWLTIGVVASWVVVETVAAAKPMLDGKRVRAIGVTPDNQSLMSGKEETVFPLLYQAAMRCVEEDGADVILLGSTTMHQAHAYLDERLPVPVINPGPLDVPGTLAFAGDLGLSRSNVLNFRLGASNTVGSGVNDLIDVTGNLSLTGTGYVTVTAYGPMAAGTYTLIQCTGTKTGGAGNLVLINNTGYPLTLGETANSITVTVGGGGARSLA